jgi:signal transduction histidine kinase
MRRILLLRPSRLPFESPRRIAASNASAVLAKGAGEPDEGCRGEPGVEMRGRQARVVEVVEQPQLFAQEEGAVEAGVGLLDLPRGCGELSDGLAFGLLTPAAGGGCASAHGRSILVDTAIANADSRDQLMPSRARVLTAGHDARRRVVRDLHDRVQQRLLHTIVTLNLAQRALREDGQRAESLLAAALDPAERGNAELRELAHRDPPVRAHQRRSPCRRRLDRAA